MWVAHRSRSCRTGRIQGSLEAWAGHSGPLVFVSVASWLVGGFAFAFSDSFSVKESGGFGLSVNRGLFSRILSCFEHFAIRRRQVIRYQSFHHGGRGFAGGFRVCRQSVGQTLFEFEIVADVILGTAAAIWCFFHNYNCRLLVMPAIRRTSANFELFGYNQKPAASAKPASVRKPDRNAGRVALPGRVLKVNGKLCRKRCFASADNLNHSFPAIHPSNNVGRLFGPTYCNSVYCDLLFHFLIFTGFRR